MSEDPLKQAAEERWDALVERDWDRYNKAGERLIKLLDERRSLTGRNPDYEKEKE